MRLDSIFEPMRSMTSARGPIQTMPLSVQRSTSRVLGQEAVAGMDGARAGGERRLDDRVGVEVAARRVGRADAHRDVGLAHVAGTGIGVGIDGDRADAEAAGRCA